jgi:adenosylmethionine-8-amino-7-oxononanoate aminotransferase
MQLAQPFKTRIDKTYSYWIESDNQKLLDLALGYSSCIWGYKNKRLIDALSNAAANDVSFLHGGQSCATLEKVNKKLLEKTGMKALLWTVSGSDAVEAAIQIAIQYQNLTYRKDKIISFAPSYHGCTYIARVLNGERKHSNFINITVPAWTEMHEQSRVEEIVWNNLEFYINKDSQIGGIILESMPWFNGHRPWSSSWWEKMKLLQKKNILLIIDDVACGFGKVAPYLSHQRLGFEADIVAAGKALTGGYAPASCAFAGKSIFPVLQKDSWWHGHTFHPYIPALHLINECLDMTDEARFEQLGKKLISVLSSNKNILHHRGLGLIREVFLRKEVTPEAMLQAGIFAMRKNNNSMTIVVPQIADEAYWQELDSRLSLF